MNDAGVGNRRVGVETRTHFRWVVCGLLFLATMINYVDRQVLSILASDLKKTIGWNASEYGSITASFQGAYALGMLLAGRVIDLLGTRLGYALFLLFWSLAAMGHAFAGSAAGFAVARFFLGLGEAGNFPAAVKTVAEWFPSRERALATGLFNAGANVGAIVAPVSVPLLAHYYGWQSAFLVTGAVGLCWLILWFWLYRKPETHPRVSESELAYIRQDGDEPTARVSWRSVFPHRQTWAFAAGKLITDPVWWFFLFWLPLIFEQKFNWTLTGLTLPLIAVFLAADIGSILGGWLSSRLIKRGWSINRARKTAMAVCAAGALPVVFADSVTSPVWVTAIFALAAAAHQGWAANLFTLVPDMFPRRTVGAVVGIGGMAGALSGMVVSMVVGDHVHDTGSYALPLTCAALAYLVALAAIHGLVPRLAPIKDLN